jgi:hypothetical protein
VREQAGGRPETGLPRAGAVYAVGQLAPQFPSLGVEKEFAQLIGGISPGSVETAMLREVLSDPDNRFLGRHLCWVFNTQQVDAFVVLPRDEADVIRLTESLPAGDSGEEEVVHVVVGRPARAGVIDSPCAASGLPAVVADQLLAFTLREFAAALPDAGTEQAPSADVVRQVFHRLTRRADNRGISDEHRALNYLALRYPPIYHAVAQASAGGKVLAGINARHSHSQARRVVSVGLTFRHRRTEITERYYCLVDVTEVFPFLVSPLMPTYE